MEPQREVEAVSSAHPPLQPEGEAASSDAHPSAVRLYQLSLVWIYEGHHAAPLKTCQAVYHVVVVIGRGSRLMLGSPEVSLSMHAAFQAAFDGATQPCPLRQAQGQLHCTSGGMSALPVVGVKYRLHASPLLVAPLVTL